jgi:hypothetical protein
VGCLFVCFDYASAVVVREFEFIKHPKGNLRRHYFVVTKRNMPLVTTCIPVRDHKRQNAKSRCMNDEALLPDTMSKV